MFFAERVINELIFRNHLPPRKSLRDVALKGLLEASFQSVAGGEIDLTMAFDGGVGIDRCDRPLRRLVLGTVLLGEYGCF